MPSPRTPGAPPGGGDRRPSVATGALAVTLVLLLLHAAIPGATAAAPLKVPPIDPAELDEFASAGFAAPQYAQGAPSVPSSGQGAQQPRLGFYEVVMLQLVAWFLLNYFWGAAENRRIKDAWLADFLPFLREQFAYVGPGCVGGEREADPTAAADPFFQETPDTFRLWASGRRHVEGGMAVTLKLRPRHDGLRKLWEFLLPAEDTLLLEASLPPAATPPLILALARRLHHRSLHLTTPDLFRYSSLQPDDATKGLGLDPARFVVYTDAPAGAQQLLRGGGGGAGVVDAVVKHRDMFQLVHVTDQNASPVVGHGDVPRAVFRVKISLPPLLGRRGRERSMAELRPLVEVAFQLLDHLCSGQFKLGAQATAESRAVRREIEAREARFLEALRREEAERRRQEREREAQERLTPEQVRKKELKQERKDKKKVAAGLLVGRR